MNWTVDYGDGSKPIELPHAWRQDVAVTWEGPAVYRTELEVVHDDEWLVFDGASYQATIYLDGKLALDHLGIWDSFAVALGSHVGGAVEVEVSVTKNGGASFPVKDVLSGFIPFVYHTFGGLYGGVRTVRSKADPTGQFQEAQEPRVAIEGNRILLDGEPFYLRGVLSWGWYPELGHMNPNDEAIRREVRTAKELGFNTIKFCLWVPRHRFFEILEEEGMFAWLELPLWDPTGDADRQAAMERETERIVKQYRHHRSIIAWTAGCELSTSAGHEFRKRLVEMIRRETKCPLVKDNSGGAEMYRGDLREHGTFEDFHPYCDTHFYPTVLDSLRTGPRQTKPILFGEFNDFDVHRDLNTLKEKAPYWASANLDLNDQGVRWQHDLPSVLRDSRWTEHDNSALHRSSVEKGAWMRCKTMEHVRSMDDVAGYVTTGWRHTPISTSGMVDDDLSLVFDQKDTDKWNRGNALFLIPTRRPPWVHGGNRPGWLDAQCFFTGQIFVRVGTHTLEEKNASLTWDLAGTSGRADSVQAQPCRPCEVVQISVEIDQPGEHVLEVDFGGIKAEWPIWIVDQPSWSQVCDWEKADQLGVLDGIELPGGRNLLTATLDDVAIQRAREGATVVSLLTTHGTVPVPFWRECAFEFHPGLLDFISGKYERLWGLATDSAIDQNWLKDCVGDYSVLMNRVDTRTYKEHPYVVAATVGEGRILVTTLRPYGMQGCQPWGVNRNPSGTEFLRKALSEKW